MLISLLPHRLGFGLDGSVAGNPAQNLGISTAQNRDFPWSVILITALSPGTGWRTMGSPSYHPPRDWQPRQNRQYRVLYSLNSLSPVGSVGSVGSVAPDILPQRGPRVRTRPHVRVRVRAARTSEAGTPAPQNRQ